MILLFDDESQFSITIETRRIFIWRKAATHYLPTNVSEIDHYGSGDLMVRADIMLHCLTFYHIFEKGTVTSVEYRDAVFEPYVHIFWGADDYDFNLMNGNA